MQAGDDPSIVKAPWGPEIDGRRLLNEAVGFGRALRAAGLAIDLGAAVDYARALPLVDMLEWIVQARRPETREKRIAAIADSATRGEKAYPPPSD